jgi:uncharacterized protein YecT (DUF1311 family)
MIATAILLMVAQAEEPKIDCKSPDTQYDMNMCAGRRAEREDAALNRQWVKTKAVMAKRDADETGMRDDGDPSYVNALLASQRAWLAFRDAECKLASYSMRGGSAQSLEFSECIVTLTADRTRQLAQLAKDL